MGNNGFTLLPVTMARNNFIGRKKNMIVSIRDFYFNVKKKKEKKHSQHFVERLNNRSRAFDICFIVYASTL